MNRKHTPIHDFWHRRVEGQIQHTINCHPEWFSFRDERERKACINSLGKRILGEIVAALSVAAMPSVVLSRCVGSEGDDGCRPGAVMREGVVYVASLPSPWICPKCSKANAPWVEQCSC